MKRIVAVMVSVLLLSSLFSVAYAEEANVQIEYFPDGSYVETVIADEEPGISLFATTKTKSKKSTYYSADGVALWYVKVTGVFNYNGSYAECTSATVSSQSYSSNWKRSLSKRSVCQRDRESSTDERQCCSNHVPHGHPDLQRGRHVLLTGLTAYAEP